MRGITFSDQYINDIRDTFYVRIRPDIYSLDQFFDALFYSCWFPSYFGSNWNALLDMMRDFEWIIERNIIIRHVCLPKLKDEELKIYLKLIILSMDSFENDDKRVTYMFSNNDKTKVEQLISEIDIMSPFYNI